jgi:thioredoxin 1
MENKEGKKFISKSMIKIIVPIFIIVGVIGIWFAKNISKPPLVTSENPDFQLYVTKDFDFERLKSYDIPIMLDFGASYCPPCREMAPVIEKLNKELQGKAIIKYIDIEKFPELTNNYPISVIPTQIFFDKEGKPYTPIDPEKSGMIMYSLKDTDEHVITAHEGLMTSEEIVIILKEMGMEDDK